MFKPPEQEEQERRATIPYVKTVTKEVGRYMSLEDILDKLDDLTLKRVKMFEANLEKKIREKIEEKKGIEGFEDPRDDEMMSEIYPEG